jgi:hypothetical protein
MRRAAYPALPRPSAGQLEADRLRTMQTGTVHGRGHFDRARLPDPLTYYANELERLRAAGRRASARCPLHDDTHPSLSVNLAAGAFRCHVPECGAQGAQRAGFPHGALQPRIRRRRRGT